MNAITYKSIYVDPERETFFGAANALHGGTFRCVGRMGTKDVPAPVRFDAPNAEQTRALKKAGKSGEWLCATPVGGSPYYSILIPSACRPAMEAAQAAQQEIVEAANRASREAQAKPEAIALRAVMALFDAAADLEDYPGSYFPALEKAQSAMVAWRAEFPEAARARDAARLIEQAEKQERLAAGALDFSADGWFDESQRKARAAEFSGKAAELRAKAEEIKSENK